MSTKENQNPQQQSLLDNLRADYDELREGAGSAVPAPSFDDTFLRALVKADSAYATLPRKFLAGCGLHLKAPEDLGDEEIREELWRAIWAMSLLRLLLENTDHLDDRQLYRRLFEEELMEPANFQPGELEAPIYVTDLIGTHSREDKLIMLTYYTDRIDEDYLSVLKEQFKDQIPEPQPRPSDRDQYLP